MALKFSDEQLKAIEARDHNILVSAGAGSGKTAVLTERIYRLVKEGKPITRFLVLTFTNAAAMSMKSKIRAALLKDENLASLAPDIENAHIETFDAFCLYLVKKYAYILNISPDITVIDQTILSIQEKNIIKDIFKEWFDDDDAIFDELVTKYSIKNTNYLTSLVSSIIHLANLQLDKEKFYSTFVDKYLSESFIKDCLDEEFKATYKHIEKLRDLSNDLSTQEESDFYYEFLSNLLKAKSYDELRNLIIASRSEKLKSCKECPVKKYFKNEINDLMDTDYGDSASIITNFKDNIPCIELLISLAQEADERISEFQKDHNAYSFSDVAKMAITLVRNDLICKEISDSFDFILVDEYQDTSDIQEEVITRLARNNLYMVGDVKQSIYRFRNANCNIFNKKYLDYKSNNGGEAINMNRSFRSRIEIVTAINDIFSKLMTEENNIINYSKGHDYKFGAKYYSDLIDENGDYKVDFATYELGEDETSFDKEMKIITSDIIRKINSGYKVVDDGILRPCTFKDFAIIIDRKTKFDDIRRYFTKKSIPINVIQDESLNESEITYITKNLIKLFCYVFNNDYGVDFKHAYCSIARSFLMSEKDKDIYKNIKFSVLSELEISKKVQNVIHEFAHSSLYEILDGLYKEFDVYGKIPTIGDCSSGMHKCDLFLSFASNMDALGYSLQDMYDFFDDLTNSDCDIAFTDSTTSDDAVTLINIHKSKGLEYKIVYMPFLDTKFNRLQQNSSFVADQKYGINLPLIGRNVDDSLILHLIKEHDSSEDFEEKLRTLYVALTRAKEKLVLIVKTSAITKGGYDIKKATNFANVLSYIDVEKYITQYQITDEVLNAPSNNVVDENITFKSQHTEAKELTRKRASKEKTIDTNEALLEYGTKIHYALELLDYKTKDLSYIKDEEIKSYVNNVISSFVFDHLENATILNEYKFFDEVAGINGIIDCLIIKEDEIDIVDFKLKNISDFHYDEQLHIYEDYVKKISTLPIKKFLISAFTGEVREIE